MSNLTATIRMMNEMCHVIVDMEYHGIGISIPGLEKLKAEYKERLDQLEVEIEELILCATGRNEVNMDSPQQLSELIYSRGVIDKEEWKRVFNLGAEERGGVSKPKRRHRYTNAQFVKIVRTLTEVLPRFTIKQCPLCLGEGKEEFYIGEKKRKRPCATCEGRGFQRISTGKVSGFKVVPEQEDVSVGGFSTSGDTLEKLSKKVEGDAKQFLTKMVERNKISHYLDTFIAGIEKNTGADGVLHPKFHQTIAATARLSSTDPNFHNQPRGTTFPIRRVVISKFNGGKLLEGDFKQLEFRAAAELSGCRQALKDIQDGIDIHKVTASIIGCNRQDAKEHTFKPLYGGTTGTDKERAYYAHFAKHYLGITNWHQNLIDTVLRCGILTLPTGREYRFTGVKRYPSGAVSFSTQIKNYPVQGFATADIVPVVAIECHKFLIKKGMQSHIINEIHDSIVIDCHPNEIEECVSILEVCMSSVHQLMKERYGFGMTVPIEAEYKIGDNWLDMKEIKGL